MFPKKINAGILGTGFYVPEKILTNFDLEKFVDTNDEWVRTRSGIKERHIVEPGVPVSELAYQAAVRALADAKVQAEELDLIIMATVSADYRCPATACLLQERLGAKKAAAFDLSAACSGFVYALVTATQFIENGVYKKILVIGGETLSKYINWEDRNTCVLFGDGAGAAVMGQVPDGYGVLGFDIGADGSGADYIGISAHDNIYPANPDMANKKLSKIHMDGKEVFKFAVKVMGATVETTLNKINMDKSELDWLVPHQANIRIIQSAAKRLAMPLEKVIINISKYGNVSGGSIPMALAEAAGEGRFRKGDVIALAGFGSGLTWASCILRWAKEV